MRDLVKILIAVGVGVAIALTVALSVTLTREKPSSDDLGAQRFPDYNFVTFNDLWNGQPTTQVSEFTPPHSLVHGVGDQLRAYLSQVNDLVDIRIELSDFKSYGLIPELRKLHIS